MPRSKPISVTSRTGDAGADPGVHVCSLLDVHDVLQVTGASYLVTVINAQLMLETPQHLQRHNHLKLTCNDIAVPTPGLLAPEQHHVEGLVEFAHHWNRQGPLVVHCWAGISRSTAAAFVTLCALNPDAPEILIARRLRSASVTAQPNRLIVRIADDVLGRRGRMLRAVEAIGEGAIGAGEARPFMLPSRYDS